MKLKFKITGFTKFPDGEDGDCVAVTEDGKDLIVDPFVGCAWEYKNREHLLDTWFEGEGELFTKDNKVFLPQHLTALNHAK